MFKKCSKCNQEKELNKDNFEPRKNTKDGFRNQCKDCRNEIRRKSYVPSENNRKWTDEEISILETYYPFISAKDISEKYLTDRTPEQITDHAIKKLNLKKDSNFHAGWSQEQIDYLIKNYSNYNITVDELSSKIGKSNSTVTAMANSLGLFKDSMWTDDEKYLVEKYYPYMKTSELKDIYLKDKSISQITKYANDNSIFKTEELINNIRINNAINNLKSVNNKKEPTKPESIIIDLLNEYNIRYKFQEFKKYYWIDFYLPENNLIIEVQGDYFHCNPLLDLNYKILDKNKIIAKDIRKHSYFRNKGVEILYLWESDIIKSLDKCGELIKKYINNNGKLDNYHSFNYSLIDNQLVKISDEVAIGY